MSSGGGHLSQLMSLWEMLPIQAIKIGERKFVFADSRFYVRTGNTQGNSPGMVSTPAATGVHWVNTSTIGGHGVESKRDLWHVVHVSEFSNAQVHPQLQQGRLRFFFAKQEMFAISGVKYINLIRFLYCLWILFEVSGEDRTQSSEPRIWDSLGVDLRTLKALQLPQHAMAAVDECPDQLECLKIHSHQHTKKPFFLRHHNLEIEILCFSHGLLWRWQDC